MTTSIEAWIACHVDALAAGVCAEFARRFNRLDPDLGALWTDDGNHAVDDLSRPLVGRDAISRHFRRSMRGHVRRVAADVGLDPRTGRPCVLMRSRGGDVRACIALDVAPDGHIGAGRARAVSLAPERCHAADLVPGLDASGRGGFTRAVPAAAPAHPAADQTVATYFGFLSEEDEVLMRIKGDVRRASLQAHMQSEPLATAPAEVRAHDVSEALRCHLGRMDPAARGGEDLPDLLPGEVEIARVSLTSIHGEVTSLRARDLGDGRYALRLVGEEDEGEHDIGDAVRARPLTCAEVVELLAAAEWSPLEAECGYRLSSFFHPELAAVAAAMGFTGEGE